MHRRLPKRGFNNIFRVEYAIVNIARLAKLDARMPIDPALLKQKGIIKNLKDGVKVLGSGELKKALHVRAHKFSKKAAEIIQNAGGTVEIIGKPATT